MKRVIVGLSGGVDSSVAAYLLKEQGYEVIGLFMKNWHDESVTISNECPWLEDSNDAMIVADKLGIPFQVVDLSEQYKERIVDYMFNEYEKGRTPNPDVLCNREIKFDVFLKIALDLGADYVATGHYCRKGEEIIGGEPVYKLLAGKDGNKDQSYFLCQLSQEQLSKALFPIGELTKPEVRKIAAEQDLITADKKDSQGLCFIGKVRLPEFLQQKLQPKEGVIVQIPADAQIFNKEIPKFQSKEEELAFNAKKFKYKITEGKVVAKHQGAHYFTKG
ncbi:tRNA 2-thiouridine(34) synthase MnmA, partial [Lutibacter sp.]|uniref:tRNA 2-thiouridine(34) synthase MnmA n=1 Tax=Lutibacter sp. TaxID=1925666 RepID=UPI0035612C79